MIPIIIAAPNRAFLVASVVTIGSILGGALGYYIGAQLFETIGQPILEFYHKTDNFQTFKTQFNAQGHWAVLVSGLTPFPYKVITITAGVTGMSFVAFMFWSLVARATIFFVIATLLWKYGLPIRNFIEKRLGLMFIIFCAIFIIGITLVKFL
jgi:membrane protein YqaA with SNARE-associated domain